MSRLAAAAATLVLAAGCGGGSGDPESPERVIRGWSAAVNAGDFDRAASYFAPGAIVEQADEFRLPDRAAALDFNRGLPCRADVTGVDDRGGFQLADFRLREGRGGDCSEGGTARVRFVIRDGLIREWRQLPAPPPPRGETA